MSLTQEGREEIAHIMRVIVESDIAPKFNLLADGIIEIKSLLKPVF